MRTMSIMSLLLLFAAPGHAQEDVAIPEAEFLLPFDADTHPAVQALGDDLGRAEAARVRAGTLANPVVEYTREKPDASPVETTWAVTWTPPLDGRLGLGKRAADAGVAAAERRLAAATMRLRAQLRADYAAWLVARERVGVLRSHQETVAAQATRARQRFEAGEASGMDARRLALSAGEAETALRLAEADLARREATARAWRPDLPARARPTRPELREAPPTITASEPPQLEAARLETEQARLEARLAGRFLSFPELQAGWRQVDVDGRRFSGPVLGAAWNVPLFDRAQGARLEATRRHQAAKGRLAITESHARADVTAAYAAYEKLRSGAHAASESVSHSDRLVAGAVAAFRAGEESVTALLETLDAVRESRMSEIEILAAALSAQRDLEAAAGQPLVSGGDR